MMEFIMTRVVVGICGVALLAAVLVPFGDMCDDREDAEMQEQCDNIALIADTFWSSEADTMTVSMNQILPTASCTLEFDGMLIKLCSENKEYRSACHHSVETDKTYTNNDIVKFTKNGEVISGIALS